MKRYLNSSETLEAFRIPLVPTYQSQAENRDEFNKLINRLVESVRYGDASSQIEAKEKFGRIMYEQYFGLVRAMFVRSNSDLDDMLDVQQDACLTAWKCALPGGLYEIGGNAYSYFMQIFRTHAIRYLRECAKQRGTAIHPDQQDFNHLLSIHGVNDSKRWRTRRIGHSEVAHIDDPLLRHIRLEQQKILCEQTDRIVAETLEQLTELQRQVFKCCILENRTQAECANELRRGKSTIRLQLHYCLATMQELLMQDPDVKRYVDTVLLRSSVLTIGEVTRFLKQESEEPQTNESVEVATPPISKAISIKDSIQIDDAMEGIAAICTQLESGGSSVAMHCALQLHEHFMTLSVVLSKNPKAANDFLTNERELMQRARRLIAEHAPQLLPHIQIFGPKRVRETGKRRKRIEDN